MVTAHGDENSATLHDSAGRFGHAGEIAGLVRALDRDIADVGHRHADEILTTNLNVIPAQRAGTRRRSILEDLPRRQAHRRRTRRLTCPIAGLRCAGIERNPEERHLGVERVKVANDWYAKECPRRNRNQLPRRWLRVHGTKPY